MCCLVIQHLYHLPALWALCHELQTRQGTTAKMLHPGGLLITHVILTMTDTQGWKDCFDWSAVAADFFASCWLRQDRKKCQLPSTLWTKMLRLQSTPEKYSGGFWPFDLVCLLAGSLFKLFAFLFLSFFVLCDFSILLIFPCWGN